MYFVIDVEGDTGALREREREIQRYRERERERERERDRKGNICVLDCVLDE